MITHVKFVTIPVRDQNRSLKFFTEVLGFKVATDQEMGPGGQRWIELKLGGAETKVVLFTPPGHEDRIGSFMPMAFICDDVFKTYEELKAKGVEFVQEARKEPWGASAIFKDPDGNQFVIGLK